MDMGLVSSSPVLVMNEARATANAAGLDVFWLEI